MSKSYEPPQVKVIGSVEGFTQAKPGMYFDFPGSQQGNNQLPIPGAPGTGTS